MGVEYSYEGPNFRRMGVIIKAAIDAAFSNHQKKYLPKHFQKTAHRRYPDAYKKRGGQQRKHESFKERWARMSNSEKEDMIDFMAKRRMRVKERRGSDKLPLVDSGTLRLAASAGSIKSSGPTARRKASIPAPHYLNFHKPGQIHKKAAIQAINSEESKEFIDFVEDQIDKYIQANHPRIHKRSQG